MQKIILELPIAGRILYLASASYRRRWNIASFTEAGAMDAILTGISGAREFEERGMKDVEILRKFVSPDSVVLDLGCGIGRVDKYLSPYCKRLCGVDVSDRMLALAKKRLTGIPNVELYRNNGRDLSQFRDETFDLIVALLLFHHLDRQDAKIYLGEIIRVLKQDGKGYLQFPNRLSPHFSSEKMEKRRYDIARTRWYTESQVVTLLQEVGFRIMSTTFEGSEITEICRKR
jgi:ubiquinone/menaquinone biosynthesis C-methylase UbiE